jgi:hypothetical protein
MVRCGYEADLLGGRGSAYAPTSHLRVMICSGPGAKLQAEPTLAVDPQVQALASRPCLLL